MTPSSVDRSSLVTRGARVQFATGVALVSIIPLLTFLYLYLNRTAFGADTLVVVLLLAVTGFGGYGILRKYPVNIVRLRGYLEHMIYGELPEQVQLLKAEDDIAAVERCLNLIVDQLRERLGILQQEKKNLQQQLYQMQKMESLGVMAAGVAHDFNNLLTGILGNVNLLSERVRDNAEVRQNIKDMEDLVMRASELTHQMLTYCGKAQSVMVPVDANMIARDMDALLSAAVAKGVHLQCDLAGDLPKVHADPTQLRQVMMNLVINASDAIGARGGKITIATRAIHCDRNDFLGACINGKLPEGECVCIEVGDNGYGIDAEKQAKIFDPFFSTKPRGRGLGLAVVLGIIVAHKGAVVLESEPGKGTMFRILLPAVKAA